jgi:peroxiredoxin
MARQLNAGDLFPEYEVKAAAGQALRLPRDLTGDYAVLIFYRASW